jgi:hypothetical protein
MGTKLTYALILTVVGAVFRLLIYFTGYETEKVATGQYLNLIMLPVVIGLYWMALKAVRDEQPHQALSYGQGVGAGAIIALLSSIFGAIYNFIHVKFINPNWGDYQIELAREKWMAAGMGEEQMSQAESVTRLFIGPGAHAISSLIMGVLFGLVVTLIVAAIVKRRAPEGAVPPPM